MSKVTTTYTEVAVVAILYIWLTAFFVHRNNDTPWWVTALLLCAAAVTVQIFSYYRKKRSMS